MRIGEYEKRWLEMLIKDSGAIDVRVDFGDYQRGGWCDDVDAAIAIATAAEGKTVYTSLNRAEGIEVTNCLSNGARMANSRVTEIRRLFLDFDPERPTGQPSTAQELSEARDQAMLVRRHLRESGFPEPAIGLSGNGFHLIYRCAFYNTESSRRSWGQLYKHLCSKFSTDTVKLDPAVKNAGRLTRFYGTKNVKGDSTSVRPHRDTQIWIPDEYTMLSAGVLCGYLEASGAEEVKRVATFNSTGKFTGTGDYKTLDVAAWFQSHGLYIGAVDGNVHAVRCPWEANHSTEGGKNDVVIFTGDGSGWPGFHCKHGHCAEIKITDVMEALGDADRFCAREWSQSSC